MATFKIALIQQKAVPGQTEANLHSALNYIGQAKTSGADMVLFPEMWSNGYAPPFEGAFDDPWNPKFQKEREFPESARVLMLKGAELILVPNACDMNPARFNQLSARAFENMTGIAMANYPNKNWGTSCAFSPIVFDENGNYLDNTLVKADETTEQILIAEFDLEKIRAYREAEPWGSAYRKPQAYSDLLDTQQSADKSQR